ncbi:uncharacterized protein EAF01_000793 [Botrytis porri]|uniref:Uncharacterized protein n=1 Tax=Botrytis porri TaxID=87229 RepID=A0A4Z1L4C3_9HELO|nr:uncharacterized protein EAF01_000793 [Botrytis porri]KAF7914387.1 hypothetical protein EAF01_000793 [Botrytis porri]TGO91655.1 hypothetical protein BPOR_0022g00400 [Botrytis porri]
MNSQQVAGLHTPPRDGPEPGNLVGRAAALGVSSEDQRIYTADGSLSGLDKPSIVQQTILPSGQVVIGGKETQYVGATHWAAILDDIGEVKEYFDQGEDDDIEEETGPEPSLLSNTDAPPTKAKLLAALPSRKVVDKIVQGYFNGANPRKKLKYIKQKSHSKTKTPILQLANNPSILHIFQISNVVPLQSPENKDL